MEDVKSFLNSKTIAGAVIAMLPQLADLAGFQLDPKDAQGIWNHVEELMTIGGSLLAIYGRVSATKRIG